MKKTVMKYYFNHIYALTLFILNSGVRQINTYLFYLIRYKI